MKTFDEKKSVYEKGFNAEKDQRGCSQCLVFALKDKYGIPDHLFKAASGFTGGLGLAGEGPCGAFLGGVMILSYLYGRDLKHFDDISKLRDFSKLVRIYKKYFIKEYGSFECADIQKKLFGKGGFKLYNPEERELFDSLGAHVDKCPDVVGKAAQWVVELVEEYQNKK